MALGRLAVDVDGPEAEAGRAILDLLDLADRHQGPPPPGRRFPRAAHFVMSALAVARTPGIALPRLMGRKPLI